MVDKQLNFVLYNINFGVINVGYFGLIHVVDCLQVLYSSSQVCYHLGVVCFSIR